MIQQPKECLHNWEVGYVGDLVIFCTKCNRDADDVYDEKDFHYATHWCEDGRIVKRDELKKDEARKKRFLGFKRW